MFFTTRRAPRGPYVEDPDAAQHVLRVDCLVGRVKLRDFERGRRLIDQRRGHFARIQREPDGEKDRQHNEEPERDGVTVHGRIRLRVRHRPRAAASASPPPHAPPDNVDRKPPTIRRSP